MTRTAMIRVDEIYGPVVQGEGPVIGTPTVFVRTGGCDYRCAWCDTLHAVLPEHRANWRPMTAEAILAEVARLSGGRPCLITLSGGNPALQPLAPLIALGRAAGYRFGLETQGSIARPWFADLDHLVLSPKPPSSGVATDWAALDACVAAGAAGAMALKVPVFDDADYAYARTVQARYPGLPFFLQVGNPAPDDAAAGPEALLAGLCRLGERVCADGWLEARVLPQMHVLTHGSRRGV